MKKYLTFFLGLFLSSHYLPAQNYYFAYMPDVSVSQNNTILPNPWAGGFNSAQFSTIKLNNDNVEDLVVFDRTTSKITTFIATPQGGSYQYIHTPKYESLFPSMVYWMLLIDYNNDGKKDIFTHTNGGIIVYKNTSAGGNISFSIAKELVTTEGFSGNINLSVSSVDIPAIVDMDNDGDYEILTYDFSSGSYIEYNKNLSKETYNSLDSLVFQKVNSCWGRYSEGFDCDGSDYTYFNDNICSATEGRTDETEKTLHTGSTLLILDMNGDGHKDAIIGDVSCNNLYTLTNQYVNSTSFLRNFDNNFPKSKPVNFSIFPAAFSEDVDFDGIKDLLVSPNTFTNEGNLMDFQSSAWFYKNTGSNESPDFQYQNSNFLQNSMIELGENATPAFADLDGDGDLDMLVGNKGNQQSGNFYATFYLYENIGTSQKPNFQLKSSDYLSLSTLQYMYLKPFFLDYDKNGAIDFVFTATTVSGQSTEIKYILNSATSGSPMEFNLTNVKSLPVNLTSIDNPFFYDMDGDNDWDLFLGKYRGNLEFYRNTGSKANPVYTLENSKVCGISESIYHQSIAVTIADIDKNNKPELITGDDSGQLKIYTDFIGHLSDSLVANNSFLLDSLNQKYSETRLGGVLFPVAADLNGDNLPDLIVGMQGGGITLLQNITDKDGTIPPIDPDPITSIPFPNPTDRYVYLNLSETSQIQVYSSIGQEIKNIRALAQNNFQIDMNEFAGGLYLFRISNTSGVVVKKLILRK